MDWIIVRQPPRKRPSGASTAWTWRTRESRSRRSGGSGDEDTADDAVTEYIGYAKNDDGGIDRYTWVNDIELEDLENYQARRVPVCAHCGRVRPLPGQIIQNRPAVAQAAAEAEAAAEVRQQIAGRALAMQMAADVAAGLPGGMEALSAAETSAEPPEDEPERYDGGPCPGAGARNGPRKNRTLRR